MSITTEIAHRELTAGRLVLVTHTEKRMTAKRKPRDVRTREQKALHAWQCEAKQTIESIRP
jgi:hypothetical protein